MELNKQVSAERVHIGFFGKRNAGKSSLVNAVTGQNLSVVSDIAGTTTDPVQKAMELLPIGPVVIIDTPGNDDTGTLGGMRVARTAKVINKTDIAVLVVDINKGMTDEDKETASVFVSRNIPYIIAYNKCDNMDKIPNPKENEIYVSAAKGININELKEMLGKIATQNKNEKKIISDLVKKGDTVILVVPIDSSAPKGRLILPQQQVLREVLDIEAAGIVTRETMLKKSLQSLKEKPKLVITDSQVFKQVAEAVPADILLTSFSVLFARYKGNLDVLIEGAKRLDDLKNGDTVLISEGCTHHRQCEDIGTVKLPGWIKTYSGKNINFEFTSGGEFPDDLSKYALCVHCGGCMLNEREMKSRIRRAGEQGVPMTNYGTAIAQINGILKRATEPFFKTEI